MKAWALVPARGGSKSIPLKNLVPVCGVPLIDFGVRAAQACRAIERIVCSTEDELIARHASDLGIEVDRRPGHLAGDDAVVADVARDFLQRAASGAGVLPDCLVLVQPTSPFLLPEHIESLLQTLAAHPTAQSCHTVTAVSHNDHAWNQRQVADGQVQFLFANERRKAPNKQAKPKLYIFGNLIAARTGALLEGGGFYAEPCVALPVPRPYHFDLDGPEDLQMAEALITRNCVVLPHMQFDKL